MKTIAVATHKGGVGKTTTSLNLSDALARAGLSVLLVDLDPQFNATRIAYSYERPASVPVERVLAGEATMAEAIITECRIDGVHMLGSTLKLSNLERTLQLNPFTSTRLLSDKLKHVAGTYDVVVIDCPPSLGSLTANALASADLVIVPIDAGSKLSLTGSDDMIDFIEQAKNVNPRPLQYAALLNMYDGRTTVCRLIAGSAHQYFKDIFSIHIPDSTAVQQAETVGKTILKFNVQHQVSRAMVELAREVMDKLGIDAPVTETA
jgi:chromosome partitioning protein